MHKLKLIQLPNSEMSAKLSIMIPSLSVYTYSHKA